MRLKCSSCGKEFENSKIIYMCPECSGPLIFYKDFNKIREKLSFTDEPSFWRYADLLPEIPKQSRISLGEG
ncbi:MAG: threonine synthase, partial [Candidatus Odinarchaeia archaeon]